MGKEKKTWSKVYVIRARETGKVLDVFTSRAEARTAMKVGKFLGKLVGKKKEITARFELAEAKLEFIPKRTR